jgi:hypothetical protein
MALILRCAQRRSKGEGQQFEGAPQDRGLPSNHLRYRVFLRRA